MYLTFMGTTRASLLPRNSENVSKQGSSSLREQSLQAKTLVQHFIRNNTSAMSWQRDSTFWILSPEGRLTHSRMYSFSKRKRIRRSTECPRHHTLLLEFAYAIPVLLSQRRIHKRDFVWVFFGRTTLLAVGCPFLLEYFKASFLALAGPSLEKYNRMQKLLSSMTTSNPAAIVPVAAHMQHSWGERLRMQHPQRHIPVLDGIRGLAIIMVLIAHFTTILENYLKEFFPLRARYLRR